jgi:hypothetical protein
VTDDEGPGRPEEDLATPFSFKLMVVLVVLYLGWRLVQGVLWVIDRLTG